MTEHETLARRLYAVRRQPNDPNWSDVLDRAGMKAEGRSRIPRRQTTAIVVAAAIAAMGFAGVAFSLNRPSLPFTTPGPEAAEVLRKAPGTEETNRASPRVDGQTWDLRSYQNVGGDLCFSHEVPGEAIGTGCMPAEKLFERGPLRVYPGARQEAGPPLSLEWDNQWVYGIAHPDIKTLTLVNMDCSTVRLPLDDDGAFHHVVGRDDIRAGKQQYKLIARGARGELLVERDVAVSQPLNARKAGLEPPRPKRACA